MKMIINGVAGTIDDSGAFQPLSEAELQEPPKAKPKAARKKASRKKTAAK